MRNIPAGMSGDGNPGERPIRGGCQEGTFFYPEVKFCGHILGGGTRRPEPGKLMAIEKW